MTSFNCGNCRFMHEGERDPMAAGARTYQCYYKPPLPVALPSGQGQLSVLSVRPGVNPNTPACGSHKVKVSVN